MTHIAAEILTEEMTLEIANKMPRDQFASTIANLVWIQWCDDAIVAFAKSDENKLTTIAERTFGEVTITFRRGVVKTFLGLNFELNFVPFVTQKRSDYHVDI